jgi:ribosomal protein L11 methyltransferase
VHYLQFDFTIKPAIPGTDIVISELAEAGFESFEETATGCKAWIPAEIYNATTFEEMAVWKDEGIQITYQVEQIAPKNWNAEWESNFEPVINGDCMIRAPFHPAVEGYRHEVIILPQMSFGTGHHETTFLMVGKILTLALAGQQVLDMGCGTGVLAILASKLGASSVTAIDNNEHAVENTAENILLNNASGILVHKGDAQSLQGTFFNCIFANINRNVLLSAMEQFALSLLPGGRLLLSGFFETDIPQLLECCNQHGLQETDRALKNGWALLEMQKVPSRTH